MAWLAGAADSDSLQGVYRSARPRKPVSGMPQGEPAGSQGDCEDIWSSGVEEPPASAKVQSGAYAGPPIGVKKRPPKKRRRGPAATAAAAAKTLRALLHAEHPNVALRGHSKAVGSAVRFLRKLSNSPGRSASLPWEYAHARFRAALAAEVWPHWYLSRR